MASRQERLQFSASIRQAARRSTFSIGKDGKTRHLATGQYVGGKDAAEALRRAALSVSRPGLSAQNFPPDADTDLSGTE